MIRIVCTHPGVFRFFVGPVLDLNIQNEKAASYIFAFSLDGEPFVSNISFIVLVSGKSAGNFTNII